MAFIYAYDDVVPVIDPTAFVHETAVLIGDVIIGPEAYVGPGASLRGDSGRITVLRGANLQDNVVAHTYPGGEVVVAGKLVTSRGPGTAIEFALKLIEQLRRQSTVVQGASMASGNRTL